MDALDAALANRVQTPRDSCLSLRGREGEAIRRVGIGPIMPVLEGIREAYCQAWTRARPRLELPEREDFKHHRIFATGGGSLLREVISVLAHHPSGYEWPLEVRRIEKPEDLFHLSRRPISGEEMPFVSVAYGLTYDAFELPEPDTPDRAPIVTNPRGVFTSYEDM